MPISCFLLQLWICQISSSELLGQDRLLFAITISPMVGTLVVVMMLIVSSNTGTFYCINVFVFSHGMNEHIPPCSGTDCSVDTDSDALPLVQRIDLRLKPLSFVHLVRHSQPHIHVHLEGNSEPEGNESFFSNMLFTNVNTQSRNGEMKFAMWPLQANTQANFKN